VELAGTVIDIVPFPKFFLKLIVVSAFRLLDGIQRDKLEIVPAVFIRQTPSPSVLYADE
jgi:hypothetical protein